jgi:hypothetical protein
MRTNQISCNILAIFLEATLSESGRSFTYDKSVLNNQSHITCHLGVLARKFCDAKGLVRL